MLGMVDLLAFDGETKKGVRRGGAIAAILLLVGVASAQSVRAWGDAQTDRSATSQYDTGAIFGPEAAGSSATSYRNPWGGASGKGNSLATYGALHAYFDASADTTNGGTLAVGSGKASFLDTLTITGTPGSMVTLTMTAWMDGFVSNSNSQATAAFTGNAGFGNNHWNVQVYTSSAVNVSKTFTETLKVGDQIDISGDISASGSAWAGSSPGTFGAAEGVSDFGDTAAYAITVNTPGGGYTSASGHIYAVPEPAALACLGFGVAGLVRRKRH
jgi:hypothetical protein